MGWILWVRVGWIIRVRWWRGIRRRWGRRCKNWCKALRRPRNSLKNSQISIQTKSLRNPKRSPLCSSNQPKNLREHPRALKRRKSHRPQIPICSKRKKPKSTSKIFSESTLILNFSIIIKTIFYSDDNLFTPQKRKIKAKKVTSINFDELKIQNDAFTFKPMSFSKEMQK